MLSDANADGGTTFRFGDICTNRESRFVGDRPEYVIVGPAIAADADGRPVAPGETAAVKLVPCITLPLDGAEWQHPAPINRSIALIDVRFLKVLVSGIYDEAAAQNVASAVALRGRYATPKRAFTRADIPSAMTVAIEGIDADGFAYAKLGAENILKIDPEQCEGGQCLRKGAVVHLERVDGRDVVSEVSAPRLDREATVELQR